VTPFSFLLFSSYAVFQVPIRVRDLQQLLQTPQFRDSIFWLVLSYRILDVPDVGGEDAEARERPLSGTKVQILTQKALRTAF
jgi:hypothetical protein